jgi:signal transduction histidine kinase
VIASRLSLQDALGNQEEIQPSQEVQEQFDRLSARTEARVMLYDGTNFNPTGPPVLDSGTGGTPIDDIIRAWRTGHTTSSTVGGLVRIAVPIPATGRDGVPAWVLAVRQSETQATRAVGVVRRAFVVSAIVSLAVAALLGFLLSGTLVRRIVRLRRTALALASGDVNTPPPPPDQTQDEVGDLARALRSMHEAIGRQEAARRTFVSTASHELRTPITSIQGNLELLAEDLDEGALDAEDARQQVAGAKEQLARLANLATELLDLSRLDAGVELRSEPVDVSEIVRAVAAEFAQRAIDRKVLLEVVEPRGPIWAIADPGATARIVRILTDNALRFSPQNGLLRVGADYAGDKVRLEVSDQGPGIDPSERERIFDRFARGSRTGGEGGFGLGLAIGRELARQMDGELALVPEASGSGAVFECTLPIGMPG